MFYSRRRKSAVARQSPNKDLPPAPTAALPCSSNVHQDHVPGHGTEYEEIADIGVDPRQTSLDASINNYELATIAPSAHIYARPNNLSLPSSPAAAPAAPVTNAAGTGESSVYNDISTTLVDNALYDLQQPVVTSSNAAETADDVTDHTLIDNDLYERAGQGQGQQNPGSTDAPSASAATDDTSTTLVDNPLYDSQQQSVTSSNVA